MANTKLSYPQATTYAIIWSNDRGQLISYTEIGTKNCFESKWSEIDYYTDRDEWLTILRNNGINPDED